jgi:hypothetical protein
MNTGSHYQQVQASAIVHIMRWALKGATEYYVGLGAFFHGPDGQVDDSAHEYSWCVVDDFGNLVRVRSA